MRRIEVHIGHYGSGKTEISLNRALELAGAGEKVTLVDIDIVNPYFRSGEQTELLEGAGIEVLRPTFEGTNLDIPSLPAEIQRVFVEKDRRIVFDVGGDPAGAAVLGRYVRYFAEEPAEVYVVVNTLRPWSTSVEEICWMTGAIAERCRLPITGLIHNTNLARQSTPEQLVKGQELLEAAARQLSLPVVRTYAQASVIEKLPTAFRDRLGTSLKPLSIYTRPEWLDLEADVE